jgi:hypothetical protein
MGTVKRAPQIMGNIAYAAFVPTIAESYGF